MPGQGRAVELCYFGGLTLDEAAKLLGAYFSGAWGS